MSGNLLTILIATAGGALLGRLIGRLLHSRGVIKRSMADGLTLVGLLAGLVVYMASLYRPAPGEPLEAVASAAQFEGILAAAQGPVVVDFGATWCGYCRIFEPVVRDLRNRWEGQAEFYSVDVDAVPELASRYGVQGLPTLLILVNGEEYVRTMGVEKLDKLNELLDAAADRAGRPTDIRPARPTRPTRPAEQESPASGTDAEQLTMRLAH